MAVIDELVVQFASDTSKLVKGLADGEKKIKDFANRTQSSFNQVGNFIKNAFKGYLSFQGLKNLTFDFAKETENLANKAQMVGAKAGDIQALGNALEHFGGNADDAVNSMKALNNATMLAKRGGGAFVDVAKKFGIWVKPTQTGQDALLQIGKQLGHLSTQQRIAVAKQLGLSDSLVRAFADGGEELTKLLERQKELGTVTEEDVKISKKFNSAWLDLGDTFNAIKRDISRLLIPLATKFIELITGFFDFIRKHKELVLGFFAALAVALAPVIKMMTMLAIRTLIAFAPFLKIVAIVTAIALVFEDLYYYFMGWDSVTGRLVKKFPWLASSIDMLKPIVVGIVDTFNKILDFLKDPSWDNFISILTTIGSAIAEHIKKPFEIIKGFLDYLMAKFPMLKPILQPFADLVEMIADGWQKIADLISSISLDGIKKGFDKIGDFAGGAWDKAAGFFGIGEQGEKVKEAEAWRNDDGEKKKTLGGVFNETLAGVNQKIESRKAQDAAQKIESKKSQDLAGATEKIKAQSEKIEEAKAWLNSSEVRPDIKIDNINVNAETPAMPMAAGMVTNNNGGNAAITNNNNFTINQNVSTASPQQLINATTAGLKPALIRSVDAQTQQYGRL